jgi:hypothetical protein
LAPVVAAVLVTLISPACKAFAGSNANAKILIHLTLVDKANICTHPAGHPGCASIVTAGRIQPYFFCPLLVTDGDAVAGVGGLECGISYATPNNFYIDWFTCASNEFPTDGVNGPWPQPLSSNRIVWDTSTRCQRFEPAGAGTGVVAIAGSFYILPYSPGRVEITPSLASGLARVWDCSGTEDVVEGGSVIRDPSHLGYVSFSWNGATPGYSPCGLVTPVQTTTWGGIKAQY